MQKRALGLAGASGAGLIFEAGFAGASVLTGVLTGSDAVSAGAAFSTTGFAGAFFTGASEAVSVGTVFLTGAVFTVVSVSAFTDAAFGAGLGAAGFAAGAVFSAAGFATGAVFSAAGFAAGAAFFTAGFAGAGVGAGFFGSRLINSGSAVFGFLSTVF